MKQISLGFCLSFFCFFTAFAQSPLYIPYQAVARNAAGNLLVNQAVNLRFTVQQSTSGGSTLYQETQSTTTNSLGLFNVNIGNGTPTSGTFSGITWGDGQPKFMQVEIDPNGSGYVNMGSTQMMSVPYALYAGSAGSAGTIPTGTAGQTLYNNSGTWTATSDLYNNGTNVGISNTSPNASAILDLSNSSNLGFLPPQFSVRPTTTTEGLIIYNTTNGCLELYSNGAWQSLACPCSGAPSTPGSISGPTTGLCSGSTYTYSISPVAGATSYTWTAPANTTIYIGGVAQSSPLTTTYTTISLKITGTPSGNLRVSASNSCTTGVGTANTGVTLSLLAFSWTADPTIVGYNQSGVTYSVPSVTGATYVWSVTGGGASGSSTTNSISVSWASNGTQTNTSSYQTASTTVSVTVTGSGGCTVSGSTSVTAGGSQTYNLTSPAANQQWPLTNVTASSVSSIFVQLWGAGGAGGYNSAVLGSGAGGGYVSGTYTVTPATAYTIIVGAGGTESTTASAFGGGGVAGSVSSDHSGGGGGRSAITNGTNDLVTAGGGGGGGTGNKLNCGGAGGGSTGGPGGSNSSGAGPGGTQLAGGTGVHGGGNGGLVTGGNGSSSSNTGGGGGGGYYGGAGGGGGSYPGGGGGGSSLTTYTGFSVTSNLAGATNTTGGTAASGGATAPNYVSGIGTGAAGASGGSTGGAGMIIIFW